MEFNTAILYDIENLIGGYGRADMLSSLSLKEIYDEILKKDIGSIAIQKAYANWSNPKLNILRGDIIELGIEPVQMFGFGRGPQKNASDIQLAIDAIDIAFTRPVIKIFIIVSGDGGFSALAKKLHEYGCMVIGCAFRKATNRVFEAVCDDFIWIEEPKDEFGQAEIPEFNDPILVDYAERFKPMRANRETIFAEAVKILDFFAHHRGAAYLLNGDGMNISIFSQAISYRIIGFNYFTLGFTRLVDFIRFATHQSQLKLVHKPPSEYRLLFKDHHIAGFEDVSPLTELADIHTEVNYRLLLSKGNPIFRLPSRDILYHLTQFLVENKLDYQNLSLGDIVDDLNNQFDYGYNEIKNTILCLISAGCFMREPEEAKLSEQRLSFIPQNREQALELLKQAVYQKLQQLLGEVDTSLLERMI